MLASPGVFPFLAFFGPVPHPGCVYVIASIQQCRAVLPRGVSVICCRSLVSGWLSNLPMPRQNDWEQNESGGESEKIPVLMMREPTGQYHTCTQRRAHSAGHVRRALGPERPRKNSRNSQ